MRLRTIGLIITLALGLLLAPLAAAAQQPGKVYRIGVLLIGSRTGYALPLVDAFRQGLREFGYVEGRNVAFEYRFADGKLERLPDLAAELVRSRVDVIVTSATPAIQAAMNATRTIPIVMAASADPVGTGLVSSLARPGGNITGLTLMSPELAGKLLEILKEAIPGVTRVAVLALRGTSATSLFFRGTEVAARALGVRLQLLEVRNPDEFDGAFSAMTKERADALIVQTSPLTFEHRRRIVDLAAKIRLPAIYESRESVETGGLMSYGQSISDMYRRSAAFVDKILNGTKPADLPVEQPTKFELVINLKTAKALGLTIPPSVLIRADHVIE